MSHPSKYKEKKPNLSLVNLSLITEFTRIAWIYNAKIQFVTRDPHKGLGEYDYKKYTVVVNLRGTVSPLKQAIVLCHELGHHLHQLRRNTIFPENYVRCSFRVKWLMEIVADNIGQRLFRKHFRHLGKYTRVSNPSHKVSRGYKEAKRDNYPYYHLPIRRGLTKRNSMVD